MSRLATAFVACLLTAAALPASAQAPAAPPPPLFSTTKVDGTDGVYIFRYQGHQAMFVVTPDGVIATDPIGERRPAAAAYIGEIRKITQAPIKYVVYSHSHFDHIAGGKPFKDLGATFIAHRNTKRLLEQRKNPDIVMPDLVVDDTGGKIELGGTTLELLYLGKNHGDNSLIMRLPKEKIIFVVDFLPLSGTQFRVMADTYVPEQEESMRKILVMDCASRRPTLAGQSRVSPSYTSSLREPMRTVHGSRGRTRVSVGEERGTWWQGVPDSYSGPWLCG